MDTQSLREFFTPGLTAAVFGLLAAIGVLFYVVNRIRNGGEDFTLFDGLLVVVAMAIGTAAAVPIYAALNDRTDVAVLVRNLHTLRMQIELYKTEHGGEPPLLYRGTFPQMTQATDAVGRPGPAGLNCPYGPYLPGGIPANPFTGVSTIMPVGQFPPDSPTGTGGWIYEQKSGRIAPDLGAFLKL